MRISELISLRRRNEDLETALKKALRRNRDQSAKIVDLRKRYIAEKKRALTDSLTGLGNHRKFEEDSNALISRYLMHGGEKLAFVIFDGRGLGRINKAFGENTGDEVIRRIGAALQAAAYESEKNRIYRWGGRADTFVTLLAPFNSEHEAMYGARAYIARATMTLGQLNDKANKKEGAEKHVVAAFEAGFSTVSQIKTRAFSPARLPTKNAVGRVRKALYSEASAMLRHNKVIAKQEVQQGEATGASE